MRTALASKILKDECFEKQFVSNNPIKQQFFKKLTYKENEEDFKCFVLE
jgi:hypothetical protein